MPKKDFQTVLWTDEIRTTLDGPDNWLQKGVNPRLRYKHKQGGGGLIISAGIIGNQVFGPFLVPEGLKINSANYCSFLKDDLLPWLNSLSVDVRKSITFQQENAPSHAS